MYQPYDFQQPQQRRTGLTSFQKYLLWGTGALVAAFLFTFPTRDRRETVDRIRLQVGASELVSEKTLKTIAKEQQVQPAAKVADKTAKRGPASVTKATKSKSSAKRGKSAKNAHAQKKSVSLST
jgi:hypothetical protein